MKNEEIYNEWIKFLEQYQEYLLSNEEKWFCSLNKIKQYINENKKKPSRNDKNSDIVQMDKWIHNQQTKYKNKSDIMKNEKIYNEWTNFINEYQQYL